MRKLDALVIGNGLAGFAMGRTLEQNGKDYMTIDFGQKASRVAAGVFNPIVFRRLVKSWYVDSILPFSKVFYKDFENEYSAKIHHSSKYYKLLNEEEAAFWKKRSGDESTAPYLIPQLLKDKLPDGFNQDYRLGEVHGAGWLAMNEMLRVYNARLKKKNKLINETFDYALFDPTDAEFFYKDLSFKKIFFCEGYGVRNNPWFTDIKFKHTKGEVLTIYCKGLNLRSIVTKKIFVIPLGNNLYRVGASYEWQTLNFEPTEKARKELVSNLKKLLKSAFEIVDHRAGVRPTTHDRRPVIGQHPQHKNMYIFNGLGSKGVMLAPFFARQLYLHAYEGSALNPEADIKRYYSND